MRRKFRLGPGLCTSPYSVNVVNSDAHVFVEAKHIYAKHLDISCGTGRSSKSWRILSLISLSSSCCLVISALSLHTLLTNHSPSRSSLRKIMRVSLALQLRRAESTFAEPLVLGSNWLSTKRLLPRAPLFAAKSSCVYICDEIVRNGYLVSMSLLCQDIHMRTCAYTRTTTVYKITVQRTGSAVSPKSHVLR